MNLVECPYCHGKDSEIIETFICGGMPTNRLRQCLDCYRIFETEIIVCHIQEIVKCRATN